MPKSETISFALILLLTLSISCNMHPQIKLSKKIFPNNAGRKDKINNLDRLLKRYKLSGADDKSYPALSSKTNQIYYYKRYFADAFSFSTQANINNAGVDYALKGMYTEAGILFSEALKEDKDFSPACNNLGIIYELLNNNDKAFNMYSKACNIEPDNKFYRRNFLYFCDSRSYHK